MIIDTMLFVEQGEPNSFLQFWVPFALLCFAISSVIPRLRFFVDRFFHEDDVVHYLNKDLNEKKQELREELAQDIANDLE